MNRKKQIVGWIGVAITVLISGFWSYWGAFEYFHEGCYAVSFWENAFLFLCQYMVFPIAFVVLSLVELRFKKIGFALHILLAAFCIYFFDGINGNLLAFYIVIPFILLGLAYFYGNPSPRKWAYRLIVFIPLMIVIGISIPQGIRISKRVDDGDLGMRIVEGSGVTLAWAPRGPGWPDEGITWEEAREICKYLSEDGTTLLEAEQNIWRLPTVDEAVRSQMLHGENAGGVWDPETEKAVYDKAPDKESPLWDVHSQVIYYWTADAVPQDETKAYIIVYSGGVYRRKITSGQRYLSFRAVKTVEP